MRRVRGIRLDKRPADRQRQLEREYFRELAVRRGLPHERCCWTTDPLLGEIFEVRGTIKIFVARIDGVDQTYGYARAFLGERWTDKNTGAKVLRVPVLQLTDYDVLEVASDDWRAFCLYYAGGFELITEMELRAALASKWRRWLRDGGRYGATRAIIVEERRKD